MSPKHRAAEPLLTRHIFLDTQIYRELGHNPANPALITLKQHIDANRIVLHTTDITMAEVKRQIWERVLTNTRELDVLEKDFRRWRKQASKSMPGETLKFDTEAVAAELFECFEYFITRECRAHLHPALPVDPKIVFAKYFDCKSPFDGTDSKEFPDAFVLEALSAWALSEQDTIHVVTLDRAIGRATSGDPNLWLIASIQDVLARAGAGFAEAEAEAEAVLHNPAFALSLTQFLQAQMSEMVFIYTGDQLPDGDAYGGELVEIEEVSHWSLISLTETHFVLLLHARVQVRVEVQYEDRSMAFYNREDQRWFGAANASTEIEDCAEIELFVEVNRASCEVVGCRVLTNEIDVSGPSDYEY